MPRFRPRSLSTYLILIVFAAVVPIVSFSIMAVSGLIDARRESSERYLQKSADELALALDQEIIASIRTLEAIAQAASLRHGGLEIFHGTIRRVLATQPTWASIVLHSASFEWVLSAKRPFGAQLGPAAEPDSLREVVESGRPVVGRVIALPKASQIASQYGFSVRVPVKDDSGKVVYVLSAVLSTDTVQQLVGRFTVVPDEFTRAIVDARGTLAARSRDPEKYVGGLASETLREILERKDDRGFEKTLVLEGRPAYTAYRKAPFSGWYSALAVPAESFEATARSTLNGMVVLAVLLLSLSGILTIFFARWLKASIRSGSDAAAALARGEPPEIAQSPVREVEELRHSLLTASDLLKARERAKNDFLANMSHELRTPLGIVLGMSEALSQNLVADRERTKSWDVLKRNGEQLLRLINDILDLSKLEAQQLKVEYQCLAIREVLNSVVEDFKLRALTKGVRLELHFEPGAPELVTTDPVRLRQIVVNLVGNSLKFTDRGAVVLCLQNRGPDWISVTVEDSGIGIAENFKRTLFSEFTQGDSSHTRKYGGTGLGLSLSRKLAQLLGGDVTLVRSVPGEGSLFEVRVPNMPELAHEESPIENDVQSKSVRFDGVSVLLADDSDDNIMLIETYLKPLNVKLAVAHNGAEAVEAVRQANFDLILMDLQMPELDGFEATRRIRSLGYRKPIIALSAHALIEHRYRAREVGFTDFLSKPLKRQDLLNSLQGYLSSSVLDFGQL